MMSFAHDNQSDLGCDLIGQTSIYSKSCYTMFRGICFEMEAYS